MHVDPKFRLRRGRPALGRAARGALALALALLAGCGGGGGGGGSGSAGVPTAPAVESPYLLAEFVAVTAAQQIVHVWDPAAPGNTVEDVPIVSQGGVGWNGSNLAYADAASFDPATGTWQTLGHATAFFDSGGQVWAIDLRGGHSHAPVQLSSVTDAQGITQVIPLDAAGDQAWINVQGSASNWAVNTSMGPADAAQPMWWFAPLRDLSTGLPQYFFVEFESQSGFHVTPPTFGVRDLAFNPVPVPAVAAMGSRDGWLAADPAQPGLGYLKIGSQLRLLRWSATGVSVDAAPAYTFQDIYSAAPSAADATAVYFADNLNLLSIAAGVVTPLAQLPVAAVSLTDAGGVVAAAEVVSTASLNCCNGWQAVDKATGAVTTVVASASDTMTLVGGGPLGLLFSAPDTPAAGYVLLDPSGKVLLASPGLVNGVVWSATARLDQPPAPLAVLSCTADGARSQCLPGPLDQIDLATGLSTTLGTLAVAAPWVQGDQIDGLAGSLAAETFSPTVAGFGANEPDVRDGWQLMPGGAGSLVRVTNYLP